MKQEKSGSSPFSALSYKEQQDRWMEWRSQQLDFREAVPPLQQSEAALPARPAQPTPPPVRLPMMQEAAVQNRRRELEQVLARHDMARKQAGAFRPTSRNI